MVNKDGMPSLELMRMAAYDTPLFEEMKRELQQKLNISVALVVVTLRSDSSFIVSPRRRVPYLRLHTLKDSYKKIIGMPERMGLCSEEQRTGILECWKSVCIKYNVNLEEYYDPDMYVGVECFETRCFANFAYSQKEMVRNYLVRALGVQPKEVLASSLPGINIVYETVDYLRLGLDKKKDTLSEKIQEMALQYVREIVPMVTECKLKITFYHPMMKEYNGYGMRRQD